MRVCEVAEWVVASGSGGPPLRTICSTGLAPGGDTERAATWWHDRVRAAHKMVIPGLAPPRILELTQ
jgi:hypothetical protein